MSESNEVPVTRKRPTVTPQQAAQRNCDGAIAQLEYLGGRLFKVNKPELTEDVRRILDELAVLREKL